MIKRDKYLNKLIESRNNGFPKVITGIRRCGKSYLLKGIYKEYLLNNGVSEDCILSIELDDYRYSNLLDPLYLGEYVHNYAKGKKECIVFLDEIQLVYSIVNPNLTEGKHVLAKKDDKEIISFVSTILGLSRESNIDLYVTGSNSKMLSSDIVTEFRDKATIIHMAPLSFEEFYNYKAISKEEALNEYMRYGGMPLAVLKSNSEKKEYLKGLFDTTYFKDIIERNRITKNSSFDELCNIISETIGSLINSSKIAATYQSVKHEKISSQTIDKYIDYFIDSFIIDEARRYDLKGREEIGSLKKYYFSDIGLRNARINFVFKDEGQILENIVYNELKYNNYSVNVGVFDSIIKDKNGKSIRVNNEVDFYARKDNKNYYIQVCTDMSNSLTKEREIKPYLLLNDEVKKIIVVNKPIEECLDENGFTVIGISEFLLNYIK